MFGQRYREYYTVLEQDNFYIGGEVELISCMEMRLNATGKTVFVFWGFLC